MRDYMSRILFSFLFIAAQITSANSFAYTANYLNEVAGAVLQSAPTLPEAALKNALTYYNKIKASLGNPHYLTVIDYTASSRSKRMFVINLASGQVERYLVAHGKNSGADIATVFSNQEGSFKSSVGMYKTGTRYSGDHGLSLKLLGLDPTNDQAEERAIVLHGADYVSDSIANTQDRLGRSLGCPAVDKKYSAYLVDLLEGGSLIYAYGK